MPITIKLTFQERFLDDESFLVSVNTEYDKAESGCLTENSLIMNNLAFHLPPQHRNNPQIRELFSRFQNDLSFLLMEHVENFGIRLIDRNKVCTDGFISRKIIV